MRYSFGGEKNVTLGCNLLSCGVNSGTVWIWRYRGGRGRDCQVPVLSLPGNVPNLFYLGHDRDEKDPLVWE